MSRLSPKLALLVFAVLSAVAFDSACGASASGTIESVAPAADSATHGAIVLKVGIQEQTHRFAIDPQTRILLNGKKAELASLKVGLWATVTALDDKAIRIVARSDRSAAANRTAPPQPSEPAAPAKTDAISASTSGSTATTASGPFDWPQFLGPKRDNVSRETGLLKRWPPQGPPLVWIARGLGEGFSCVAVADGKVLTMGNQGDRQAMLALDAATGKPLWMAPCGPAFFDDQGNGPRSVPTIDHDLVYGLGAHGDLTCAELSGGKVHWQLNILQQFGAASLKWGVSESVLIDGERLICTPGGRAALMVALEKRTGRTIWTSANPRGEEAGYASAIAADVGGVRQYIQFTGGGTIGVRAADGTLLWEDMTSSCGTANCSSPVLFKDSVFTASSYGVGGALLQLASSSQQTVARLAYQTRNMKSHHGGMLAVDGYLYGSDDPGILTCLDLRSGNVMWQDRSIGKGSLVCADGHLYLRNELGTVALIEASPRGYHETGRFEQPSRSESPAWPYPVVANGRLYLRDGDALLCYSLKASP